MNNNASATIYTVFGGQFGSEGKGQIAAFLAQTHDIGASVRVGGPNAGHTFYYRDQKVVVQSIPTPAMMHGWGIIGPGGLIILDLLESELKRGMELRGEPVPLIIDPLAAIITAEHMAKEAELKKSIGSTGEGVGAATAQKVMRVPDLVVRAHSDEISERMHSIPAGKKVTIDDTVGVIARYLHGPAVNLLIEGTQGYGLSLHTGGFYPFCTSRECTPWGLYAESGVNPQHPNVKNVRSIMVVRTFPIRVGGNSGPMFGELTWEEMTQITNGYVTTPEITTVTKKSRRIGRIDYTLLQRAIDQCSPTEIALTFLDYVFPKISGATSIKDLDEKHWKFIRNVESTTGTPVSMVSTGPGAVINLEESHGH